MRIALIILLTNIFLYANGINNLLENKQYWKVQSGKWQFSKSKLIQSSKNNYFPTILYTKKKYSDIDISVNFKPISGDIDASGGVIFRAKNKDNFYIVRANALEGNFRLYTFINGYRNTIASANVKPPKLGHWNTMRIIATGNIIKIYLNNILYITHHDNKFSKGYVGLWTKADSVTLFDKFIISN